MLLDELRLKKIEIESLAACFGAKKIRVFGSVVRATENKNSDIDFLVDFPQGYDLFRQRLPLQEALESLIGRDIDLILEHEINKHLRTTILKEAKYL